MVAILDLPIYDLDGTWQGNVTDDYGVDWVVTGEEGWGSAPDARSDLQDLPDQDGADDAPTYEAARTITLTGTAVADSWLAQNQAKERLNAAAYTARGLYALTVTESHLTRMVYVRRTGAQKVGDRAGFAFDFVLSLIAPDPRKYDATLTQLATAIPGAVVPVGRTYPRTYPLTYPPSTTYQPVVDAFNAGNRDTGAQITITSGLDFPGIVNLDTGASLQFNLSLGPADTLAIDLLTKAVVLNGTSSRRGALFTGSAWFLLQPGDNNLRMVGTPNGTGAPAMTVQYRSAWK